MKVCNRIVAAALVAANIGLVNGATTMRLSADGGATWVTVVDNGALDENATPGFVTYGGPIGDWILNMTSGIGRPASGSAVRPIIEAYTFNYSPVPEDLIVQVSETGFVSSQASRTYLARIIGYTDGTVRFNTWRDAGNVLFGTTKNYPSDAPGISPSPTATPLTAQGPFSGGDFIDGTSVTVPPQGVGPYSITLETVISNAFAGRTSSDALFYSPLAFSRCPNDVDLGCNPVSIPDCNPSSVTVDSDDPASVVISCTSSTATNGCSRTRSITYTATDSSGFQATCIQHIYWKVDTTLPTISALVNKSVPCDGVWNFDVPTASDNCGQPLLTIESTVTNGTSCGYTAARVWRATDACGNSSFSTQTVNAACSASCVPGAFKWAQDSGGVKDGPDGNIRTFTTNGVSVNISAFSRTKTSGTWGAAYLGLYSGGLGVTDSSESDGSNERHTTDNIDRDNFILFEFSQPVVLNKIYLGYVVTDSDLRVWIGNFSDPFNNHQTLNDALLASFGFTEENTTSSSSTRWADVNAGEVAGNTIVIAARPNDSSPNDQFKVQILDFCARVCAAATTNNPPPPPPTQPGPLPSGWSTKDIGSVGLAGSAGYSSGTYTLTGSGADVWDVADEFRYAYVSSSSDCSIVARVASLTNTDPNAKAGILFRETLSAGAQELSVFVTSGNGVQFLVRSATGGTTVVRASAAGAVAPQWLKLTRSGDTYTASYSANGSSWTTLGTKSVTVDSAAYIGLAVTSHDDAALGTATFDNVTVSP